jgi:DNA polymerase-1
VDHRRASKQVSGFILPFFFRCDAEGVIRSDFNQIGTVTGRLSSREPNLQNVPAREEKDPHRIRRVFRARPGCSLVVADYGGIELRVLAHESMDEQLVAAYQPGSPTEDLHSLTASNVFPHLKGKSLAEIKKDFKDDRNKAKSLNFLIVYGGQGGKAAKVIGCSDKEGQGFIDRWLEFYTGVADFMEGCAAAAHKVGFVRTLGGRKRRLRPEIDSKNFGVRSHAERQAQNSPIQGGAADLLKKAMVTLDADVEFAKLGWSMLLQIHDELVCEGPTENAEKALPIITRHMEQSYAGVLRVPLKAEAKIGQTWSEAK